MRNQPGLSRATITAFTAEQVGRSIKVYLRVYTQAGDSVDSEHATIVLGDVPEKPASPPSKEAASSSASRLKIVYSALPTSATRGLPIESYSLEMDDGAGGDFQPLTGLAAPSLATSHLVATGISEGKLYRVRYRAMNAYGWGPYSEIASILAA